MLNGQISDTPQRSLPWIRPDFGLDPEKPKWEYATINEFKWDDSVGNFMDIFNASISLPNSGYLIIRINHGHIGASTRTARQIRFWSNGEYDVGLDMHSFVNSFTAFEVLDAERLNVRVGATSVLLNSLEEGYHITMKDPEITMDIKFMPVFPPVRMGSGKVFISNGSWQQSGIMPRCEISGTLSVKGVDIDLTGAIGDVRRQFGNILPCDLGYDLRFIRTHGPRISVVSLEMSITPENGGGWLCETYSVLDGQLVDATTESMSDAVTTLVASYQDKNITYRTCHPVNVGSTALLMDTTMLNTKLVSALDTAERLPYHFKKTIMANVGHPWIFEFYQTGTPVCVGGVMETLNVFAVLQVIKPVPKPFTNVA